jgi:hypothetical protein
MKRQGEIIPFGYNLTSTGRLEPNKAEQKAIPLILDLWRKRYSLREICRELEKEGDRTKNGGIKWHPPSSIKNFEEGGK